MTLDVKGGWPELEARTAANDLWGIEWRGVIRAPHLLLAHDRSRADQHIRRVRAR